ncbi:prepilin-type N-terminal cleavage/methylation domain-containing protein [Periweissella beninensis]|uniref:Prepilin-type N-terminal cleavage/methylation domain-containing protein n=2 Tax=Periweissella beninensis TaxID=504936 RepID=A0ABT0VJL6_9LACO|nr:prepilin-type N-terminal cleavage/methylation domain-containing protein [Periweissella beninensis]MCT4396943.1 prepilin-type N-terminal cleavage/methylation domain-containing protein [Periweissella beninensis]
MYKGFTLIEAVLVLTIVSGLMLFGYYQVDYAQQRAESRFWQALDLTWRQAQMATWDSDDYLDFRFYQHELLVWQNGKIVRSLPYPRSIICNVKKTKSVIVSNQGVIQPTKVILITQQGVHYEISWGFNWGTYKITPEPAGVYHR